MTHLSDTSIVISPRVIRTLQGLPADERDIVSTAVAKYLFLGIDPSDTLSPYHKMIFAFILDYVRRDTRRDTRHNTVA